jgi:hypothetical protein
MSNLSLKKIFITTFIFLNFFGLTYSYDGSNQTDQLGFWHTSKVDRIQLGWDERIYVYLNKKHKCLGEGSDLIFYEPTAKGREMILSALLSNGGFKEISFRIDSCHSTENGVIFGYFDKLEINFMNVLETEGH